MKDIVCLCVAVAAVFVTDVAVAANRFFVPSGSLPAGASDQSIELRYDSDDTVLAYSFGIEYEKAVLSLNRVSTVGTVAETAFVVETIDAAAGTVGFAVVLVFDGAGFFGDRAVPAGQDRVMAFLEVDVLATTDAVTTIAFAEVVLNPAIPAIRANVMTSGAGLSIIPTLENGDITIQDRTPNIQSLVANSGLSGQVFQVVGDFFDEPGLAVTVCGSITAAVLRPDGVTLDVTAPSCVPLGFAEVMVCTDRGCDVVPNGFDYVAPPPTISRFEDNTGQEGTVFVIFGTNFQFASLTVKVCEQPAGIVSVSADGTAIVATAPNCGNLGPAVVEVCTEGGCVSDTAGFFFEFAGPRFARGDCDGNGAVEGITDTIFMICFLFGGDQLWPCVVACDFNNDLGFDVSDAVYLLLAAFAGGAPPPPPTTCGPGAEGSVLFGCNTPQC